MALNDSFEILKNLLSDTVQAAAKATRGAAAATKANLNILSEQDRLKKAYLELGKLYYRDFITGEEPDDAEYLPLCDAITEATKNIESLRGTVEEIRGRFFRTAEKELEKLDGVEKPEESPAAHPIIEVVDDMPVEEPERED